MIGFLRAVTLVVFGAGLVAFGVANRHSVQFVIDPFVPSGGTAPFVTAPLSLFLFGALLIGVLIGGVVVWRGQGKWRRAARQRAREAHELRREVERLTHQLRAFEEPRLIAMPAPGRSGAPNSAAPVQRSWLTH
jgi:hypothetical protein